MKSLALKPGVAMRRMSLAPLLGILLAAPSASAAIKGLERVSTGLGGVVQVTHAPNDPDRLFVVQKGGVVRILDLTTPNPTLVPAPLVFISDTDGSGHGGLQSIAFHPDYANNGKFYVHVTVDNGGIQIDNVTSLYSSRIREYTVDTSGPHPVVDPNSQVEILNWVQPQDGHNGGWIGFSPNDGYLYIMSGDGGKQEDPDNNSQTLFETNPGQTFNGEPLGKVLRIDVDDDDFPGSNELNYAIPPTNPFVGDPNAADEIWAYGMRNPWRASFDRQTGDLWIGDVGQSSVEEIDFQPAGSPGGENYGWNRREGTSPHLGGALLPGDVEPVYDFAHGDGELQGNSVVGGYVYRGPDPTLQGQYFFADTSTSKVWMFDPADPYGTVDNINDLLIPDAGSIAGPVSFGEDLAGNLYLVNFFNSDIFRIDTGFAADFDNNGVVDQLDLTQWQGDFGQNDQSDADGDGDSDGADFIAWQRQFDPNGAAPVSTAVPEPASAAIAWMLLFAAWCSPLSRRRELR